MEDIERLRPHLNKMSLGMQTLQNEFTKELSERDALIVTHGSIYMLTVAAERAGKKMTSPRFIRSIKRALLLTRKFRRDTEGFDRTLPQS